MNEGCDCVALDVAALQSGLSGLNEAHPHLFSEIPVFVSPTHVERMQRIIQAVEDVVKLPGYRETVLRHAPPIARHEPAAQGVLFGFDFHIGADGPKLIEINSNAGGALLNVAVRRAQQACCGEVADYLRRMPGAAELEDQLFAMFLREWRLARGAAPLTSIAIVDQEPLRQYLHPEFLLFQDLFEARGIRALIVDPAELVLARGVLTCRGEPVDLVYNRLTDFYFAGQPTLAEAYARDAAVFTPDPRAHALYANKENLALLTDPAGLREIGAGAADIDTLLNGIPRTKLLQRADEAWWSDRKQWFFKPAHGFGSRGSYRGDKMTRRVFAEIANGQYVAQQLTPPGERWRAGPGGRQVFKVDVRNYVYEGRTQLMAARLYQGQTTNFRTVGGGFAPVYSLPAR